MVELLSFWLKERGYDVIRAVDGKRAIKRWHEAWPDMVLLDLPQLKRDGLEVCQQMQSERHIIALILFGSKG
jgi:CheY-like chemotaxis protein